MFADKVLDKLFDGYEEINNTQKVDYLLLLMRGNNVTITDDFIYYCQDIMNASNYKYFLNSLDSERDRLNLWTEEHHALFFSMVIGLGFGVSRNLRLKIKSHLSTYEYHKFHVALDYYYNLLRSPHDLDKIVKMPPQKRTKQILDYINNKLLLEERERFKNIYQERAAILKGVNALKQRIDKASIKRSKRAEHEESNKRRENRERIAKRAGLNRESGGHSVWSTNIILTNMGGKK